MKSLRRLAALCAGLATTATLLVATAPTATAVTDLELATRWAPIHRQDTDSSDYDADHLSKIDFDLEWDTLNNWEHQDDVLSRMTGTVYYSVVETSTHWFIGYGFYHPRDWEASPTRSASTPMRTTWKASC